MEEEPNWYQPPRRKTPSFSSSLLDAILRSIDETNDHQLNHHHRDQCNFFPNSEPKCSPKIQSPQTHYLTHGKHEQIPSLRSAIMIDQWMETHDTTTNNKMSSNHVYNISRKSSRNISSDSSSSVCGTTTFTTSSASSEQPQTPSAYRSLPNSFTISRKQAEAVFLDDSQKPSSIKFIKSTKLRAMKIYGDLKKVKQPISPGTRISTFLYSLFASSKKSKINQTNLKKSRSIKQDSTTTCTSFSRSCMSKKQHNSSGVKRSVRFYPENDTLILDRKSINERVMPLPNYERRRFTENKYMKNYKKFMINVEDEDEDDDEEDDLFELEIVGGVSYGRELPVFETTDLRKIRI